MLTRVMFWWISLTVLICLDSLRTGVFAQPTVHRTIDSSFIARAAVIARQVQTATNDIKSTQAQQPVTAIASRPASTVQIGANFGQSSSVANRTYSSRIDNLSLNAARAAVGTNATLANDRITLSRVRDLNFGTAVVGPTGGTITIAPAGLTASTGSVILQPSSPPTSGEFQMSITPAGEPSALGFQTQQIADDRHVSLLLPHEVYITKVGGTDTFLVDNWLYTIDNDNINVGATLHVTPDHSPGPYLGEYLVTIILE